MKQIDRIRNMSVKELAKMFGCQQCIYYGKRDCADHHSMDLCNEGIERWLESEVEE